MDTLENQDTLIHMYINAYIRMFMVNLLKVSDTNKKQSEEEETRLLSGEQATHDAHISRAHISTKFNLYCIS